jgi:integration host factor subunit beta
MIGSLELAQTPGASQSGRGLAIGTGRCIGRYLNLGVHVNKSELIEKLAQRSLINVIQSEEVVNLIYRKMRDTLISGGRIEIRGFGSFVVKEYGAYEGRNPKTGEKIPVPPKKLPFFKVGKELKERIDDIAAADAASSHAGNGQK